MAAQDLCTLADVKLALETADTGRDTLIAALITDASDAIMEDVGREFAPATGSATRRFRVDSFTVSLEPYDLRSVTTATLHPESASPRVLTAVTEYQLAPVGAATFRTVRLSPLLAEVGSSQTAFTFGFALLDITGAWGFATVPGNVKRAAVLTVTAWMRRDVNALIADLDAGRGLPPLVPLGFAIPKAARELLAPFAPLTQYVS